MQWILDQLRLDNAAQEAGFQQQWDAAQIRIITLDGSDVGWLQTILKDDEMFIAQLFVDGPFQRRGIGTEVMHRLIGEASRAGQKVVLSVVKINPARRLYERFGFQVVHEDEIRFYMKLDPRLGG